MSQEERSSHEVTRAKSKAASALTVSLTDATLGRLTDATLGALASAMSKAWARLTCVGDKEKSKNRVHQLTEREWSMGRKTSCSETLADNIISSVHCRIRLERSEHGVDVVLEDLSSNGTHVNGTRVGKHNTYALQDKDEIGIGTPVVGGKAEHYGYVFHDLRRELEYDYLQSLLAPPASSRRSSAAPPSVPRDGGMGHLQLDRAPTVAVMPKPMVTCVAIRRPCAFLSRDFGIACSGEQVVMPLSTRTASLTWPDMLASDEPSSASFDPMWMPGGAAKGIFIGLASS